MISGPAAVRAAPDIKARFILPLLILALVAFLLNFRLAVTVADPDLWGYLAFGKLFWGAGAFPYHDVFTYLPTLPLWIYHEWLTGVIFYPLYQSWGAPGLQLLRYGLALATIGLLYLTSRRQCVNPLAALFFLFLASGFLSTGYNPVRAQVFTFFCFALTLYLLETARQTGRFRLLGLVPLIQLFWGNLHGGFVAGLGLIFLYLLGEAVAHRPHRPYLVILAFSGLATLINPYGLKYWQFIWHSVLLPRPDITEWGNVWRVYREHVIQAGELAYYVGLALLLFFFLAMSPIRARWREAATPLLILFLTLYLGLKHVRHMPLFCMAFAALLPGVARPYLEDLSGRMAPKLPLDRLGLGIPILALALFIALQGYLFLRHQPFDLTIPGEPASRYELAGKYYPTGAVAYLQAHRLSGKLLTELAWGEYLIWVLYPHFRVALDGRYETVYPEAVSRQYFDFFKDLAPFHRFLRNYPPDLILIKPHTRVHGFLLGEPQWLQVYADTGCALFRRQE